MRVALIGDFKPAAIAHQAVPAALSMAGADSVWIHTGTISNVDRQLADFDGIWCVPASPYENTAGALDAIRYAREQRRPFLGSCGVRESADNAEFVDALRAAGNKQVTAVHFPTDHSYSDQRTSLSAAVLQWLAKLPQH